MLRLDPNDKSIFNAVARATVVVGYWRMAKRRKSKPNLRSILKELQDALASRQFQDEIERASRRSRGIRHVPAPIMVKQLRDIKIKLDGDKAHQRPHVHIDYGKNHHAASFAIDNGERLAGGLNRKYDRPAREWIARNREILLQAWDVIKEGGNAEEIVAELRVAD
jgi:hypothetical protein